MTLRDFRFGVNYVPSRGWYYGWNDWQPDAIRRDLDAVAALHADHIRLQLIWPFFQPNPAATSAAHLDRLAALMEIARDRRLDVCVAALNGWLSGYAFLPPFGRRDSFFTSPPMLAAQERYFTDLAAVLNRFPNFLGFDLGNELNCCWQAGDLREGDAWFHRMMDLVNRLSPGRVHVNGVDHQPWFWPATFSPQALTSLAPAAILHCYIFFTGALKRGGPFDPPSLCLAAGMTALAKAFAGDPAKPIWIQEFGASSEWMEESRIPDFMDQTIRNAVDAGATWFTWWCSHDIERHFKFDSLEYDLGLITLDQKLKPTGRRFRDLADALRRQKPPVIKEILPPPPDPRSDDATWEWLLKWIRDRP